MGKCTPLKLQLHVNSVIAPKCIRKYDNKTQEPLELTLKPGEKELVVIFHDESSFHANDQQQSLWLKKDQQVLRSKSRGRIVHVSDFIVEETGRLVLNDAQKAAQAKLPTSERLPVDNAIKIRKLLFPDKQAVWVFDNSSAHGAFAPDALQAQKMNVNPGGAQPKMRQTRIPNDNPDPSLRGKVQNMVFQKGEQHEGEAKGMEQVLRERGLYHRLTKGIRGKPVGVCATCKLSEDQRDELARKARAAMEADPDGFASFNDALKEVESDDADPSPVAVVGDVWCCMHRCLAAQTDFLEEKPLLQQTLEAEGNICLFLPKFHCELNPIELYWGWSKFSESRIFPTARKLVPEILDSCDVPSIRRFFRKTWRYLDGYRRGLSGKELEAAVKKYKAHRKIPASAFMDIQLIS
ncbi:hypothetical protein AURDEDRAFT_155172 [Auricularia subglabra TFB-10046 SS5]|nr:hypothetical protein AURDEDRAFT_155172 [Auricularia subglabra TFB-10046 SS5]